MIAKFWRRKRTPSSKPCRVERRRFRPLLEMLEERLVHSQIPI
jgi:hypothetical protein